MVHDLKVRRDDPQPSILVRTFRSCTNKVTSEQLARSVSNTTMNQLRSHSTSSFIHHYLVHCQTLGVIVLLHRDDDFSFGVSCFKIPDSFRNLT